jgi:hypothetical protein
MLLKPLQHDRQTNPDRVDVECSDLHQDSGKCEGGIISDGRGEDHR